VAQISFVDFLGLEEIAHRRKQICPTCRAPAMGACERLDERVYDDLSSASRSPHRNRDTHDHGAAVSAEPWRLDRADSYRLGRIIRNGEGAVC
jgi:hypothetical protein